MHLGNVRLKGSLFKVSLRRGVSTIRSVGAIDVSRFLRMVNSRGGYCLFLAIRLPRYLRSFLSSIEVRRNNELVRGSTPQTRNRRTYGDRSLLLPSKGLI